MRSKSDSASEVRRMELAYAELHHAVGSELGIGDWLVVDQARIDAFAEATNDLQWIHIDPDRAASGPFGSTIAHGFLSLSLVAGLLGDVLAVRDRRIGVNYGLERVRFTAPVPVGARVRLRATLNGAEPRAGGTLLRIGFVVELEGSEKPAVVGEMLTIHYGGDG
jgi:acyl dehydratase